MRVVALALALLLKAAPAEPAEPGPGVVFVVGGVGGCDALGFCARAALPAAGVVHEIREFEWTHGKLHPLRDLQDTRHLVARAAELAEQVRAVRAERPAVPIYLIGHSAGGGLVLLTAAQLPPDTLERIILLSPAMSPEFDLRPALRATRREVVSFYSRQDRVVLDWGTSTFGTVDRIYSTSAGHSGFREPDDLNAEGRELYRRLVQEPWRWESLLEGRGSGHNSTTMPWFLKRHVAPWLRP
jgi:pimeloyl-ACP methyl ester carboxylesterase